MTWRIFKRSRITRPAPIHNSIPDQKDDVRMPVPELASPPFPQVESLSTGADSASPVSQDSVDVEGTDATLDENSEFDSIDVEITETIQDEDSASACELAGSDSEFEGNDSDDAHEPNQGGGHTFKCNRPSTRATFLDGVYIVSANGNTNVQCIDADGDVTHFNSFNGAVPASHSGIIFHTINDSLPVRPNNTGPTYGPRGTTASSSSSSNRRCNHGNCRNAASSSTSSSNTRRGNYDNRNASSSSTRSGSSTGASNRSAAVGGGMHRKRASGYTIISDVRILSVGGNIYG